MKLMFCSTVTYFNFLEPIYFNLQFCKCYLQNLLGDSGFGIKIGVLDWSLVSNVGNSDARLCDE